MASESAIKVFLQGVPEAVLNVLANTNATVTNLVTGLTYEFKVNFFFFFFNQVCCKKQALCIVPLKIIDTFAILTTALQKLHCFILTSRYVLELQLVLEKTPPLLLSSFMQVR